MPEQCWICCEMAMPVRSNLLVCVQSGDTDFNPNIRQYDGIELIVDWPERLSQTMGALTKVFAPSVRLWRWAQDPRIFTGWPGSYVQQCPYAVFGNEPDIEGLPAYYVDVCTQWQKAGGKLVSPAFHDESRWKPDTLQYDVWGCHCYSGDFSNYEKMESLNLVAPIWMTEYAHQNQQDQCLSDIANIPPDVPVALFAWHWLPPGNQTGYDVADIVWKGDSKVFIVQAGHLNIASNCDTSLQGGTGALGEVAINVAVADDVVQHLTQDGFAAKMVDANFNCDSAVGQDYSGVLALHCQSNPPNESGWDIGTGDPAQDGAASESQRLVNTISAWYEAETGLNRRQWCQGNPNVQHYYLFEKLSKGTPFALIEMCNADVDRQWSQAHHDRMVAGIVKGIEAFLAPEQTKVSLDTVQAPAEAPTTTTPLPILTATNAVTKDQAIQALETVIAWIRQQ